MTNLLSSEFIAPTCFTDAVIQVQDVKFPIHKIIMCKCSSVFRYVGTEWCDERFLWLTVPSWKIWTNFSFCLNHRALFIRWSRPEESHFMLMELSPAMMQLVIEFAYTNNVLVTEKTVRELLQTAGFLNIRSILSKCCNFLDDMLCAENCIGIYQLTKYHFCIPLEQKAYKFILNNFESVESSKEFPQLDMENLCSIIANDHLCVRSEAIVFKAIIQWITYAIEDRRKFMAILFSKVEYIWWLFLHYLHNPVIWI